MGRNNTTKERLITAAMDLIYARGYSAVGVQEICTHAGVNKGSFYHFFPSKQSLVLAVIEAHAYRLQENWHEAMSAPCSLRERLCQLFEATYESHAFFVANSGQMLGCPLGNLALELSSQDPCIRQKLHDAFDAVTDLIAHTLTEAMAAGELPAVDVSTTAQSLLAYFQGVVLLAKTQNDPAVVQRLALGALHLLETATHDTSRSINALIIP